MQPRRIFVCFSQVAGTRGQEEYIIYCIYKEYTLLGILQQQLQLHYNYNLNASIFNGHWFSFMSNHLSVVSNLLAMSLSCAR